MKNIILITGCSSGIGLDAAITLAKRGHQVIATMRNLEKKTALVEKIKENDLDIEVMQLDVTALDSIQKVVTYIQTKYGRLDTLINNAGFGVAGFFEELTLEEYRLQMETNYFGVINVTKLMLPLLQKGLQAKIINISSLAGLNAVPGGSAYNSSKWALEGFSECLRYELNFQNIKVFLVEPGPFPTKAIGENMIIGKHVMDESRANYTYTSKMFKLVEKRNQRLKSKVSEVTGIITKITEGKIKRLRTKVGSRYSPQFWIRALLPFKVYEWLLNKFIG
ncbi:SDR family NAD(P)-dependent oxidoreductase [Flexithrix dorotheae]|uniref:SDR family NAD(P)-dependent oxidoreductase n=1 Tax=Flexithrix dorotheae TaxID=70993 RepID=UPI000363A20B|nr:SDR family NAD(P)-dependent oxidoreductase [Flexithrix dorotheae]